jgi:hypothetical protein
MVDANHSARSVPPHRNTKDLDWDPTPSKWDLLELDPAQARVAKKGHYDQGLIDGDLLQGVDQWVLDA